MNREQDFEIYCAVFVLPCNFNAVGATQPGKAIGSAKRFGPAKSRAFAVRVISLIVLRLRPTTPTQTLTNVRTKCVPSHSNPVITRFMNILTNVMHGIWSTRFATGSLT